MVYSKLAPSVKDGTKCKEGTKDMCVFGKCRVSAGRTACTKFPFNIILFRKWAAIPCWNRMRLKMNAAFAKGTARSAKKSMKLTLVHPDMVSSLSCCRLSRYPDF